MFRQTLRRAFSMGPREEIAPFSRAVVNAMRALYPEELADKSWDNTGLLLEAPFDPARRQKNSALLTVDLTRAVADEAIRRRDSIVVAYHPIIFRGLKSLSLADTQQQSLLRLAAAGISVYSPHTAIDAATGGLGDWLADIVTSSPAITHPNGEVPQAKRKDVEVEAEGAERTKFIERRHPDQGTVDVKSLNLGSIEHERSPIIAVKHPDHPNAGMGRIVRFSKLERLPDIIDRISRGLGSIEAFSLALPNGTRVEDVRISSVGICAGSGGNLFKGLDVDLLFTGELSHHEALAAVEKGQCVICLFHSNTERGYLRSVLKPKLQEKVKVEWDAIREESKNMHSGDTSMQEALHQHEVDIDVSEEDRDPYIVMVSRALE